MATRYWVGGAGSWNASSTTNWSATSGGSGGASVPTASDDVIFNDSSSPSAGTFIITLTVSVSCRTISYLTTNRFPEYSSNSILINIFGSNTTVLTGTNATGGLHVLAYTGSIGTRTIAVNFENEIYVKVSGASDNILLNAYSGVAKFGSFVVDFGFTGTITYGTNVQFGYGKFATGGFDALSLPTGMTLNTAGFTTTFFSASNNYWNILDTKGYTFGNIVFRGAGFFFILSNITSSGSITRSTTFQSLTLQVSASNVTITCATFSYLSGTLDFAYNASIQTILNITGSGTAVTIDSTTFVNGLNLVFSNTTSAITTSFGGANFASPTIASPRKYTITIAGGSNTSNFNLGLASVTWDNITNSRTSAYSIYFPTSTTVINFSVNGASSSNKVTLQPTGATWTFVKSANSGATILNNVAILNSTVSTSGVFPAYALTPDSTDLGGNTRWVFTTSPSTGSFFFL
jgi:hypothetical protein